MDVRAARRDESHGARDLRCFAPTGEVTLSAEHTAVDWMTPAAYVEWWCAEELESVVPEWAGWIREVRANCALLEDEMRRSPNERALP